MKTNIEKLREFYKRKGSSSTLFTFKQTCEALLKDVEKLQKINVYEGGADAILKHEIKELLKKGCTGA